MIKKWIAALLAVCFLFACLPVCAAARVRGDVDADGRVLAGDARLALRRAVGLETYLPGSGRFLASDMDGNGEITAADAREVLRAAVGLPAETGAAEPEEREPDAAFYDALARFSFTLFREAAAGKPGENVLISPLSVYTALMMTANGAAGETRAAMERALGGGLDTDALNAYLYTLLRGMPETGACRLHVADSLWVHENRQKDVLPGFLAKNLAYYGAGINVCRFDGPALEMINGWVKEQTDGMIGRILDEPDPSIAMLLLNALSFEGEWGRPYRPNEVRTTPFRPETGPAQEAEMMVAAEGTYLENDLAVGFEKPYAGGGFHWIALLPKAGVPLDTLLGSLTAGSYAALLESRQETDVAAGLPKLRFSYETELGEPLKRMGLGDLFDAGTCDLSAMFRDASGMYVEKVLHRTFIETDTLGTRAAAVTGVVVEKNFILMPEREVILDRPFVFLITYGEARTPVFIGAVRSVAG